MRNLAVHPVICEGDPTISLFLFGGGREKREEGEEIFVFCALRVYWDWQFMRV